MNARERVTAVINHEKPDRVPVYGWVAANLTPQISEAFGSVAAFEDKYEFDLAHLFGSLLPFRREELDALNQNCGGMLDPATALELPYNDPDDEAAYADIAAQIKHHQTDRGRFVYVQTPGIFEAVNDIFGIENHLMYMAMYPDDLKRVYERQANWNRAFAGHCLDLGVDMIHISDDWGGQEALMFSPAMWREFVYPYHKLTADHVKERGGYLSLHSDGNINQVKEGIIELGYDVVHPWQESAGMSLVDFKDNYRDRLTVLGGLDVQTTIGFGDYDKLAAEIDRVLAMFADGGLLYCTSHFVQDHCSIDELTFAYDRIYETVRA